MFLVHVQIEALDRHGLLTDLSLVLSEHGVNLLQGNMMTTKERVAKASFVFEMADPDYLDRLLRELRKVEGVFDAYRVTGSKKGSERRIDA